MGATLAAASAVAFFMLALAGISLGGFDRGAAAAVILGLLFLAIAVTLIAARARPG